MLDWISEHSEMLNLATNVLMVLIWLVYLQVFLASFRRQAQPKIVINRAAGVGLEAACFVSNMSSESIYLENVLTKVRAGEENWAQGVTDFEEIDDDDKAKDPRKMTLQGPLHPGDYTSLGSFRSLMERVTRARNAPTIEDLVAREDSVEIEITVIADHSSDDLLIGARRGFKLELNDNNSVLVSPLSVYTKQIRSRTERKAIQQIIREHL